MDTKTVCLAVLSMGDASGYDVRKRVEDVFARFLDVAPSGIYGALKVLEKEGLVSATHVPQRGRPSKTVYSLLEPGREALVASLRASEGRHRVRSELVALVMFAELLPPEKLREVLYGRIGELERSKAQLDEAVGEDDPGRRFLWQLGLAVVEAELSFLREQVPRFLNELERDEKHNARD